MKIPQRAICLAGAVTAAWVLGAATQAVRAAEETPFETTVSVDAGQVLRTMNPRRIGGTNIAMWSDAQTFASAEVRQWMAELRSGFIRLPGGSWSNIVYWNGNGVRDAQGKVDPNKVGPDGYPAVDYSAYAPSFLIDDKTLHPSGSGWHGNVDVKTLHEFIQAIPGAEPLPCPNAGTGRAVDAAEWVKWANQQQKYNARYWEIGNELGGSWEAGTALPFGKGQLTPAMYTQRFNAMASAMRAVDPAIKIGGCAFAEEMIRDCGENVNFVSIHTYPGSATFSDAQMFALVRPTIEREVGQVRKWIHQYQPGREKQIEVAYSEWNIGGGISGSGMFGGLWCSIFLGEMARSGVDFATQWDAFTHARPHRSHALFFQDGPQHTRESEYYALWLWNNYMGDRLVPAKSGSEAVYTYASRSDDAVYVMLINTDADREAKVNVQLSGFAPAAAGELATITGREYYWNPVTNLPQWSTGPRIEQLKTGAAFAVSLAPYSMTCVRVPDQARPGLSPLAQKALGAQRPAQGKPELRFVMPSEMYVGDPLRGEVIAVVAGTEQPYQGALGPAALTASAADAEFDRNPVRLAESVGHFVLRPQSPGELSIGAQVGEVKTAHKITVKPSIPRPVVFWDFTSPAATDTEVFHSDFKLGEDLTQRANRAVARVDLPAAGVVPSEKARQLLTVRRLPGEDKLKKENIRGVVFDVMTSPDFQCEDPEAGITVVMQSPADWWMVLGDVSLKDAAQWKTHQLDVKLEKHIKAMPSAGNILFFLKANKPAKGSVYFDHIGFMVR